MQNQKVTGVLVGGLIVGAAVGAGVTMNLNKKKLANSATMSTCSVEGAGANEDALFEYDGHVVTRDDLGSDSKDALYQAENQAYEAKSNLLKELALRYALALEKDKKADLKNLPQLRTLIPAGNVTEDEMKKFFEANKQGLPPGTTYEQVKPQLQQFMVSQKVGEVARTKVAELEASGKFKSLLNQPVSPKVNLSLQEYPSKGNAQSAVTLVEVSDYLCPHCRAIKPEVDDLVASMGSKIRFVQVDFSLHPTGLSGALARGAYCAAQQSQDAFWKFHEKAFAIPAEAATAVSPDEQKEFNAHATTAAKEVGLDVPKFEVCLTSAEAKKFVDDTNSKMSSVGVNGTPTFFLNDRKVVVRGPGSLRNSIEQALATTASAGKKAQ